MLNSVYSLSGTYHTALHGGGEIFGCIQTNTKESIKHWYDKGERFFEVDIAIDKGEAILLAHHLSIPDLLNCELTSFPETLTVEWYLKQKLFPVSTKGLTPLSLRDVISFMHLHKECVFMFDLWGNGEESIREIMKLVCEYIGENITLWDRLLIELYDKDTIGLIRKLIPACHIIYGCMDGQETVNSDWLISHQVSFVSCPWAWVKNNIKTFDDYVNTKLTVFSLTSTSLLSKKLKKKGVSVNIVDYKFETFSIFFEIPLYIYYCIKKKTIYFFVRLKYFGLKRMTNKIIKRIRI